MFMKVSSPLIKTLLSFNTCEGVARWKLRMVKISISSLTCLINLTTKCFKEKVEKKAL
jgi:hypothetical protein